MPMATTTSLSDPGSGVVVRHRVPGFSERWTVPEGMVPEAAWHEEAADLFRQILRAFINRTGRNAAVFRSVAVRVQKSRPSVGFDPDVCIVEPSPPGARDIDSIRLWEPGHTVPRFSLEVVSKNHPYKDYSEVPDQCAAVGVTELVVFDPKRAGPKALGNAPLLSLWLRTPDASFERTFAGDGPVWSPYLSAWLVPAEGGRLLRVSDDPEGRRLWPTAEEAERAAHEAERAAHEAERAAREAEHAVSLQRIAELEAELRKR
jgi:Uma2 family endonuclease